MPPRTRPNYSDDETIVEEKPIVKKVPTFKNNALEKMQSKSSTSYPLADEKEPSIEKVPVDDSASGNRFDKYREELKREKREEYETPHDRDSRAILMKRHKLNKVLTGKEDVYLGANYYKSYLSKEDTVAGNATSQKYK